MAKMIKYFLFGALTLVIAIVLAIKGDSRDINDKLIATTIGIDKKDGEVWIHIEYANIQGGTSGGEGSSGAEQKYIHLKGHGKTFFQARSNLDGQLDLPIYLGGARTLLITEDFAKEDLLEYLYRVRSDENYRKKVITVTTKTDLDELFKKINDQNLSVGYCIEHTIESLESTGECFSRTTSRLLENLSSSYSGVLIPCFDLLDKEVALVGYSVVNGEKVTDFIPIEESKGLNMLKVDNARSHYIIPYKQNQLTIETTLKKRKQKAEYQDGNISFKVSLAYGATVEYGDMKTPYALTEADEQALTDELKKLIEQDVTIAVMEAQNKYKTDYIQFDDAFRVAYPVEFEKMNWGEEFVKAPVAFDIKVELDMRHIIDYTARESR